MPFLAGRGKQGGGVDREERDCGKRNSMTYCSPFSPPSFWDQCLPPCLPPGNLLQPLSSKAQTPTQYSCPASPTIYTLIVQLPATINALKNCHCSALILSPLELSRLAAPPYVCFLEMLPCVHIYYIYVSVKGNNERRTLRSIQLFNYAKS